MLPAQLNKCLRDFDNKRWWKVGIRLRLTVLWISVVCAVGILTSCEVLPTQGITNPVPTDTSVEVYYATDRNRNQPEDSCRYYGAKRSQIAYGTARVGIQRDVRMQHFDFRALLLEETPEGGRMRVEVKSVLPLAKADFFGSLQRRINLSAEKSAFIFVHGYNVTFQDALCRTAQLAYDLAFDGAPILFSWPSDGKSVRYQQDVADAEWSARDFARLLEGVCLQTSAESIYLICHSMGSRTVSYGFSSFIESHVSERKRIKGIIFAAPEIEAQTFVTRLASTICQTNPLVTLYASSNDLVLRGSHKYNGYPRLGEGGKGVVIRPNMDTIDASKVDTSLLGHSYYRDNKSVVCDLFYLIRNGKSASEKNRYGLRQVGSAGSRYWLLVP